MKRLILILALCFLVLLSLTATLFAASVTLSWQPPTLNENGTQCTDIAGYNVYVGTVSRNVRDYDNYVDVGNVTTFVDDMPAGFTYYCAVTAYDPPGNESWYSNEVSKYLNIAWTAASYNQDSNGAGHILWRNILGAISLWKLAANDSYVSSKEYGPHIN